MQPLLLGLLAATVALAQSARPVRDEEVRRVHQSALLIDTHNDVTSATVNGLDIGPRRTEGHTDLVRLKEGGVGATFFAVYVAGSFTEGNRSANRALQMIDTVRHDIAARYPNDVELVTTASDIVDAHRRGKLAALMGIEGGHAIEDSLRLLRSFYALGVRYMTLTHSNSNNWADSSGDIQKPNNGLSPFGKEVVREMNRLGMLVDISHVADKTFWDALETSRAPVFASHSSCRAISPIPRNMTDEMIVAMAKKGGVIQINFGCQFLNAESAKSPLSGQPRVRAKLADVVAHIDHVVKIAGIEAVGIGSDYDGVGCVPEGLEDVSKYPALTRALLERGYSAEDIQKIYGGNFLRLMRAAEKASMEMRKAGS